MLVLMLCAMTAYAAMVQEQIVYRAATLVKASDGRLGIYFAIATKGNMDALGAASVTIQHSDGDGWIDEYIFTPENTPTLQAGGIGYYDLVLEYSPGRGESEYRAVVDFVARSSIGTNRGVVTTHTVTTDSTASANEYTVVMKTALYSDPSDDSQEITNIKAGTHVIKISDVDAEWSKVELDGTVGYIASSYIYLMSTCYKVSVTDNIDAPFFTTPKMNVAFTYLRNEFYVVCSGNGDVNGLVECEIVGAPKHYLDTISVYRLGQIGYMPLSSLTAS